MATKTYVEFVDKDTGCTLCVSTTITTLPTRGDTVFIAGHEYTVRHVVWHTYVTTVNSIKVARNEILTCVDVRASVELSRNVKIAKRPWFR